MIGTKISLPKNAHWMLHIVDVIRNIDLLLFFFIFFSLALIFSAVAVVFFKSPVHAAISLVFSFVFAACLWLLLGAEFLSLMLILVYVGAVMVLFLFVVMMISRSEEVAWKSVKNSCFGFFGIAVSVLVTSELLYGLLTSNFALSVYSQAFPSQMSSAAQLGEVLFTRYFYPFELASVLLFLGVLSSVILAHRVRTSGKPKTQDKWEQLSVTAKDRVTIVSRPSSHTGGSS